MREMEEIGERMREDGRKEQTKERRRDARDGR